MLCYTCVMLYYNICHVMLYNMCHVMLYNMCHVMLYNKICYVILVIVDTKVLYIVGQ